MQSQICASEAAGTCLEVAPAVQKKGKFTASTAGISSSTSVCASRLVTPYFVMQLCQMLRDMYGHHGNCLLRITLLPMIAAYLREKRAKGDPPCDFLEDYLGFLKRLGSFDSTRLMIRYPVSFGDFSHPLTRGQPCWLMHSSLQALSHLLSKTKHQEPAHV